MIVAMLPSSSTITQQPFSSWPRSSVPISLSFKSRLTSLNLQFRAALVEAKPSPNSLEVLSLPIDRADDIQAETKAMARAVNASVYSPELVASRYGSKPFKVVGRAFEIVFSLGSFGLKLLWGQRERIPVLAGQREPNLLQIRVNRL